MKRKLIAVMTVLSVTGPAFAREINDLAEWRREMREMRLQEPRAVEVAAPVETDPAGCAVLKLDEAVISRGVFSSDFTIESGGREIGEVELGSGITIKSGSAVAAKASGSTVTDCAGTVIGSVIETEGDGESRFTIKDAEGAVVAESGMVDGHSMTLKGAGGMVSVQNAHWLKDSYRVSVSGVDPRLAVVATIMNNRALYRRSSERNRERLGDRPGRHDR